MFQELLETLKKLSVKQRIILASALTLTFLIVAVIAFTSSQTPMALLYAGLDEKTTAEVVDYLESENIIYTHKNGSVYVERIKRDDIRLNMAQKGLPKSTQQGYELLDNISGFGTTSEMFEATYWRAKEGELARTIEAIQGVEDARVHIAPQMRAAFVRDGNEASASVMITTNGGISAKNAQAIRHLVALSVRGLKPSQVSVIDSQSGTIVGNESEDPAMLNTQRKTEIEAKMQKSLEDLLAAHLGNDKVRVTVAVDLNHKEEVLKERTIDPNSRIAKSTDTTETSEDNTDPTEGDVSVAENVAGANGAGGGTAGKSNRQETKERINYDVSEVTREQRKLPGDIQRISVAVMVDGFKTKDKTGKEIWKPRDTTDLKAIEELVKSASGFDTNRGDIVTVKSLEFKEFNEGTHAPDVATKLLEENSGLIIQALILLIAILGLGFGIIRPLILASSQAKVKDEITKVKNEYEEKIKELTPEKIEEVEINTTQLLIAEVEAVVKDNVDDALAIIRQWLHEEAQRAAQAREQAELESNKNKKTRKSEREAA